MLLLGERALLLQVLLCGELRVEVAAAPEGGLASEG